MTERLGIPRSALYALINTLRARGYIHQDGQRGRYRLGAAVWALLPDRSGMLRELVDAFHLETGANPSEESLALSWPHPGGAVIVAQIPGTQVVRVAYRNGERRGSDTADGAVLAAGLPADGPGDDPLHLVRQEGVSVTADGDVVEISCPVCADGVRPVAAIVVGIPAYRARRHRVAALTATTRETAARLSYRMGAAVYQPYGWAAGDPVGPSRDLTDAELKDFLSGLWGAQLACIRQDGTPHVVPLWYEWDGDAFWLAASPGASWQSYVAERARVSLTFDEPWPPLRRAFVDGVAEPVDVADVPGGLAGLRRRLAVRYLGKGADKQAGLSETDGWTAFRVVPDRMHGRQGLGT
jgi:DNA-binding IclR family transcriptional regulator